MMSFMVGEEVPDEYVPMFLEEMALDDGDARDTSWDGVPAERAAAFRVVIIGAGMSGLLAAIRLEQAGHPLRRPREERGRRRHVAREQLPGLPRRRRQPLLLLLVRAESRLVGVLLAAPRAARVLRALRGAVRRPVADPIRHRGRRCPLGRGDGALVRAHPITGRPRGDAHGQRRDQRRRPAEPAASAGHPRARHLRRPGVPLRRVAAPARSARQARRRDRHRRERVPARARDREGREPADRLPALAAVDGAEPALPRARQRRRRSGCCATCRSTRAGTASCSSGPARTASCRRWSSIRSGRIRSARSTP